MMLRIDCLRAISSDLEKCLFVTIMGALPAELQSLGHRPNFFYLQHAMGLASSTGLGLALCLPQQKIVVLDGDGSLLMNLGTLSTLARYKPKNLVHSVLTTRVFSPSVDFPPPRASARTSKASLAQQASRKRAPSALSTTSPLPLAAPFRAKACKPSSPRSKPPAQKPSSPIWACSKTVSSSAATSNRSRQNPSHRYA